MGFEAVGMARTAAGKALGNAMSQNVLERLLPRVAFAAGLIQKLPADR